MGENTSRIPSIGATASGSGGHAGGLEAAEGHEGGPKVKTAGKSWEDWEDDPIFNKSFFNKSSRFTIQHVVFWNILE